MNKYANGKIYKIVSFITDDVYIGSTQLLLSARMSIHRSSFKCNKSKYCSSHEIFAQDPDASIILIKNFPCDSRKELETEELRYITHMDCINKNKGVTRQSNYYKEYYIENKTKIDKYYYNNIHKIKQYQINNKDKINDRSIKYYHKNKESLNKKAKCECGGKYTIRAKLQHFKTKKHQQYINTK